MSETSPRLFIVSPHFDDAVFSCGALLASHPDAAVCTVFAAPPAHEMHTEWDARSGFSGAREAVHARTIEDNDALATLDAIPVRMPFCDGQYLDSPSITKLAAALEEIIYGSTANTLLMPVGLFHSDHELVSDACSGWNTDRVERENRTEWRGGSGLHVLIREKVQQEYAMFMCGGPPADSKLRYAADTLALAVGDDGGSRLRNADARTHLVRGQPAERRDGSDRRPADLHQGQLTQGASTAGSSASPEMVVTPASAASAASSAEGTAPVRSSQTPLSPARAAPIASVRRRSPT